MKKLILVAPAVLAFLALTPLFATFFVALSGMVPDVMRTERYALLIFEGSLPTAAALFGVAMVAAVLDVASGGL